MRSSRAVQGRARSRTRPAAHGGRGTRTPASERASPADRPSRRPDSPRPTANERADCRRHSLPYSITSRNPALRSSPGRESARNTVSPGVVRNPMWTDPGGFAETMSAVSGANKAGFPGKDPPERRGGVSRAVVPTGRTGVQPGPATPATGPGWVAQARGLRPGSTRGPAPRPSRRRPDQDASVWAGRRPTNRKR